VSSVRIVSASPSTGHAWLALLPVRGQVASGPLWIGVIPRSGCRIGSDEVGLAETEHRGILRPMQVSGCLPIANSGGNG
jgi:hypothetical protein